MAGRPPKYKATFAKQAEKLCPLDPERPQGQLAADQQGNGGVPAHRGQAGQPSQAAGQTDRGT